MSEPIEIDLSGAERVIDPPIVDLLAYDAQLRAYAAEFVPDPHVSMERKESVLVRDGTATARRLGERLVELTEVLKAPARIVKLAHAGRDSFDFYTDRGDVLHLHDSPSPQVSFDVYAVLQALAQEVQLEFLAQRRSGRVAG
jgi:hypothetical protein